VKESYESTGSKDVHPGMTVGSNQIARFGNPAIGKESQTSLKQG